MHPELVIFDCDGVLVDSEAIVIEVEAALLAAGGFPSPPTRSPNGMSGSAIPT